MKKILLSLILISILFSACKKDQTGSTQTASISPSDSKALAGAITVYHAVKITGTTPAPSTSGTAPVLDASTDNQQIIALNGRYVVIKPAVTSGTVAGYYFKITGTDFYYKVDFSKPRMQSGRMAGTKPGDHGRFLMPQRRLTTAGNRMDSTSTDYQDSSIIIQLPANIAPGTFCSQYWMYDEQNQVSNVINVCVTVDQLGAGTDGGGFVGTWKETSAKNLDFNNNNVIDSSWMPVTYQKDYSTPENYYCHNNQLYYYYDSTVTPAPAVVNISSYYEWVKQADLIFAQNGALQEIYSEETGFINTDSSSCSNVVYSITPYQEQPYGGWSYNATTKKMVIIMDYDGTGTEDPYVWEFAVTEQTATKLVIYDENDKYWYEFGKK